jgi:peptidoglycan/xylan/chitin deacetylase (PgdA/CDA1 family)
VLVTFDDAYEDIGEYALPILAEYSLTATVFVVTNEMGGSNRWDYPLGAPVRGLMTADQIRRWADRGMEFGSHSRTHADLTQLDPHRLDEEIAGSAKDLGALLGQSVTAFAYPYGFFNRAVLDCVRRNYQIALTTERGINRTVHDHCRLNRSMVQPTDQPRDLWWRLRFGWRPVERIRLLAAPENDGR